MKARNKHSKTLSAASAQNEIKIKERTEESSAEEETRTQTGLAAEQKMSSDEILDQIELLFPEARCELEHENAWQLAIAVILSAQTSDKAVNKVTPALFSHYPDPKALALAEIEAVEEDIKTLGLFHNKAKNIIGFCQVLLEEFDGILPQSYEELQRLPGIGRKSANVIRSNAFDIPSIAVDTHVERVAKRLGFAPVNASVLAVEKNLMEQIDQSRWSRAHHDFIFFGRYFCSAKKPNCEKCPFDSFCQREALIAYKSAKKTKLKAESKEIKQSEQDGAL